MEKFIVSARKYRPQNFNAVVGQEHITTTLKNAIANNQLAHAFLFCGPRGVGKTTCARILAKTINCENRTSETEACNQCASCVSFDNGTSLNIHELDGASNNSVDDIRSLVDQIRIAPQAGKYKVYIIDEVHMLSSNAFNAFLKTLEEPPPFVIFILATTEKHKIIPTILSRCQIFDFKRITAKETVDHLQEICNKENIKAEPAALHVMAQKSEGCLRDSLSILDKIVSFSGGEVTYAQTLEHLNILDEDYYFRLLENMQQENLPETLLLFDEVIQRGFEPEYFLDGFAEFIRNLLVSRDEKAARLLEVADNFKMRYLETASKVPGGWLLAALNILSETGVQYRMARNKKLLLEMALIRLTYLNQALDLVQDSAKKKVTDKKGAYAFRAISPIGVSHPKSSSKPQPSVQTEKEGATLVIEKKSSPAANTKAKEEQPPVDKTPAAPSESTEKKPTLSSLRKIRKQVTEAGNNSAAAVPVTAESLQQMWTGYIEELSNTGNASLTWFKTAAIALTEEGEIEIATQSVFHQRCIENNRLNFTDYLQRYFNNPALKFILKDPPPEEANTGKREPTLREKYEVMIAQNPNIRELRDRLKLDLE